MHNLFIKYQIVKKYSIINTNLIHNDIKLTYYKNVLSLYDKTITWFVC